jgi:phenylpyruvate tautomerase PptA (4-oxalocrotonate tautomerase family)
MDDNDDSNPLRGDLEKGAWHTRRAFCSHVGLLGTAVVLWPFDATANHETENTTGETNPTFHSPISDPTSGNDNMPLVRIDAFDGRTDAEVKALLDAAHKAIVKAFHLNERDRYQIYNARPKSHFIMQDTGLGIPRTDKSLIITIVSKERPEILKRRLYKEMTDELSKAVGIPASDVMITIIQNSAADWTFGNGEGQFLTGELG